MKDYINIYNIQAHRVQMEIFELEIQTLVEDALQIVALDAETKGVELLCYVDPSVPPKIYGDQVRIRQILVNLLT